MLGGGGESFSPLFSFAQKFHHLEKSPAITMATTTTKTTMTKQLEERYHTLLYDFKGQKRACFLEAPETALSLLRGAWNLNETTGPSLDRISRRLKHVQSYSSNVKTYNVQSEGFPCAGPDGELFRSQGPAVAQDAKLQLQSALGQALSEMGYMMSDVRSEQQVEFHLSFLKTDDQSLAQEPHIDFRWDSVLDHPDDATASTTGTTNPGRRSSKRNRKAPYKERVPFVAFIPLVAEGMQLEAWKARDPRTLKLPNNTENNETDHDNDDDDKGIVVDIPVGIMLLARGDVVHAGGFRTGDHGNPRGHLYVYQSLTGEAHATNTANTYTLPFDTVRRLGEVYKHAPHVPTATEIVLPNKSIVRRWPQTQKVKGSFVEKAHM